MESKLLPEIPAQQKLLWDDLDLKRESFSHSSHEQRIALGMPRRMVLVRHGESEANLINRALKKGQIEEYPRNLIETPDREIRLSSLGTEQALKTGKWLAHTYPQRFDAYFVSNHVRAMETAGHLSEGAGWANIGWKVDPLLGERNWGNFVHLSYEERKRVMELRRRDPNLCPMPDGETIASTRHRSRELLDRATREFAGKDILIVSHGEFIEALWAEILHMSTEKQIQFFSSEQGDLRNCQVVEFSAEQPDTLKSDGKLRWVRSSCPSVGIEGEWNPLEREVFVGQDLLKIAQTYRRIGSD